MSKYKQLMSIVLYKVTTDNMRPYDEDKNDHLLPEWCLDETGRIKRADDCLDWFWMDDKKEYYVFDASYDALLYEEMSGAGEEDSFAEYDFRKLFSLLTLNNYDGGHIPLESRIVVEVTFGTSESMDGVEYESYCEVLGYLDSNMVFQSFSDFDTEEE